MKKSEKYASLISEKQQFWSFHEKWKIIGILEKKFFFNSKYKRFMFFIQKIGGRVAGREEEGGGEEGIINN